MLHVLFKVVKEFCLGKDLTLHRALFHGLRSIRPRIVCIASLMALAFTKAPVNDRGWLTTEIKFGVDVHADHADSLA